MKLTDIFGTTECGRCGGSGRYSYNQIDGDRCYGCNGSGRAWIKADAALVDEYKGLAKGLRETTLAKLQVGEDALLGERYIEDGTPKIKWVTVESIETYTHTFGADGQYQQTNARVHLSDGQDLDTTGNLIVRRRFYGIKDERLLAAASPALRQRLQEARAMEQQRRILDDHRDAVIEGRA